MARKPIVLLLESPIQHADINRRKALSEKVDIIKYDCRTVDEFIEHLKPGGKYSNIDVMVRNGWHKAGPFSDHKPFATEAAIHFPPSLKLICCSGHGYDAADIETITKKGILYCNTPNACTEAVANTGVALVLETFRYLSFAQWCARYDWMRSREVGLKAVDPAGMILGVVGLGDIGVEIARKCEAAFGMKVHYYGPRRKPDAEKKLSGGAVYHSSLEDLIKVSDCLVLAAPYTKETHHMLSRKEFALAKSSGLRVVNIARGKMIDEEALIEALDEGKVVGVGLDVHDNEPGINPKFKDNWMVTVFPHFGVSSRTSWENFESINWDNLEAYLETGKPLTPVNKI